MADTRTLLDLPTRPSPLQAADPLLVAGSDGSMPAAGMAPPANARVAPPPDTRVPLEAGARLAGVRVLACVGRGPVGFLYHAQELCSDGAGDECALREYFPLHLAYRGDGGVRALPGRGESFDIGRAALHAWAERAMHHRHPAHLRVLRIEAAAGALHIVMPWVEGRSLDQWLRRGPAPDVGALESLLRGVADALAELHRLRRRHGKLDPRHILMQDNGRALLLESGEPLQALRDAEPDLPWPSSEYEAPEITEGGDPIGPWSDIYALAGVLRRLFCGLEMVHAAERRSGIGLRPLAEELGLGALPTHLRVLEDALALSAARRPASVTAFMAALGLPERRIRTRIAGAPLLSSLPGGAEPVSAAPQAPAPAPAPQQGASRSEVAPASREPSAAAPGEGAEAHSEGVPEPAFRRSTARVHGGLAALTPLEPGPAPAPGDDRGAEQKEATQDASAHTPAGQGAEAARPVVPPATELEPPPRASRPGTRLHPAAARAVRKPWTPSAPLLYGAGIAAALWLLIVTVRTPAPVAESPPRAATAEGRAAQAAARPARVDAPPRASTRDLSAAATSATPPAASTDAATAASTGAQTTTPRTALTSGSTSGSTTALTTALPAASTSASPTPAAPASPTSVSATGVGSGARPPATPAPAGTSTPAATLLTASPTLGGQRRTSCGDRLLRLSLGAELSEAERQTLIQSCQ